MWTADKEVNMKVIFAVMTTSWAVVKRRPQKNSGLNRIWTHHFCSKLWVCSIGVCFGRASFADSGKNLAKHLRKANLIDNLVFAFWLLFWWSLKISESYIYFLHQLPCFISISLLFKVLRALHLVFKQYFPKPVMYLHVLIDQTFSEEHHFSVNNLNLWHSPTSLKKILHESECYCWSIFTHF